MIRLLTLFWMGVIFWLCISLILMIGRETRSEVISTESVLMVAGFMITLALVSFLLGRWWGLEERK